MTPSIDREFSLEEARLVDAGSRKLFNKPISDLIDDFERVGQEIPVAFVDLLVSVGKRVSVSPEEAAETTVPTQPAITEENKRLADAGARKLTLHQRVIRGAGALLAALRLFVPIQVWEYPTGPETARAVVSPGYEMVQRVVMGPTLMHVVGIVALAAALCVMFPSLPTGSRGKWVIALEVALGIVMLAMILGAFSAP